MAWFWPTKLFQAWTLKGPLLCETKTPIGWRKGLPWGKERGSVGGRPTDLSAPTRPGFNWPSVEREHGIQWRLLLPRTHPAAATKILLSSPLVQHAFKKYIYFTYICDIHKHKLLVKTKKHKKGKSETLLPLALPRDTAVSRSVGIFLHLFLNVNIYSLNCFKQKRSCGPYDFFNLPFDFMNIFS